MALELNGTTGVNLVQDGTVTAADLASTLDLTGKTVTLPAGVGGKVLQVVQTVKTDTASTSSQSFVDVPGMSVTLTPMATSSKVLVLVQFSGNNSAHGSIKLLRGSTDIFIGDAGSGSATRTTFQASSNSVWDVQNFSATYLDSPNTTSATTYKLQWAVPWSASYVWYLNRATNDDGNSYTGRTVSSMTVMEIAA
jgi:hypothetical protein